MYSVLQGCYMSRTILHELQANTEENKNAVQTLKIVIVQYHIVSL